MKVLMTADTVGGVWTYALELASALAPHSVHFSIATMGGPVSAEQHEQLNRLPNVSLFEGGYKLEWMENPWDDVRRAGDWLLRLEERLKPDIIHLNGYAHGALPFLAPIVVVGHSCVLSWWKAVRGDTPPGAWNTYREQVRRGLADADLVVAPSRCMLDSLEEHYGPLPRTRVIPNARDPREFKPWTTKQHMILCAGRVWDQAKNVAAVEQVAPRLQWPVYVAGDYGQDRDSAPANVHRLGKLGGNQIVPWFSKAAVFAHPARYEPFGLAPLEAGLSRCALVLGDIPSLREIWGDAALYVDAADPEALATTLNTIIDDLEWRDTLAGRALARALQYHPQRLAQSYLAAYRDAQHHRKALELPTTTHAIFPQPSASTFYG